jgi:hypothetical protein
MNVRISAAPHSFFLILFSDHFVRRHCRRVYRSETFFLEPASTLLSICLCNVAPLSPHLRGEWHLVKAVVADVAGAGDLLRRDGHAWPTFAQLGRPMGARRRCPSGACGVQRKLGLCRTNLIPS